MFWRHHCHLLADRTVGQSVCASVTSCRDGHVTTRLHPAHSIRTSTHHVLATSIKEAVGATREGDAAEPMRHSDKKVRLRPST